jgi:iron complex transport system substrate-binding protein
MERNRSWRFFAAAVLLAVLVAAGAVCRSERRAGEGARVSGHRYERIVSLSPSITETLFAIGLGDRVAGVTRFCAFPPEARAKSKVGGFVDTNYEALVALKPDLVILLPSHEQARAYLSGLGIETLTVRNEPVGEILRTITVIGRVCGAERQADSLVTAIRSRVRAVEEHTAGLARPRVLVSVGRNAGAGAPGPVYVAGPGTYYDGLVALAGGENAYRGAAIAYPELSREGITRLDPDIIVDLIPDLGQRGVSEQAARGDWNALRDVRAVKNGRVYVLTADYTTVPGPRFIRTLEDLARLFHPEVSWEQQ